MEIGIEQAFGKEGTTATVTYFSQRFSDMIQYDPGVAPGDPNYYNVARSRTPRAWKPRCTR